jgi:AcrR family transcriptional regulator
MPQVAQDVEISLATVQYHFATSDVLINDMIEYRLD